MNLADPRELVLYIKNLYCENISKEAAESLKIIRAGGMPKKDLEIPKSLLREAGSYAYQYVKPRRFLTEIDNEEFSELKLFDKWNPSDPDSFELVIPNGKATNIPVKPFDVIQFNHKKNVVIRTHGSCGFLFNILSANSFSCFSEVKNAVRELIVAYIKTKLDVDHSFGQQERFIVVEANKVIGGKYKHSIPVLKRILGGKIWKRLNPEAAKIAVKICGYKASSLEYSIIANNLTEVKDTLGKAPGILVPWIHLCQHNIWKQLGKHAAPDNAFYSLGGSDYSEANFSFPDIVKNTKEWLELKPSAWKYLIRQTPNRIRRILPYARNVPDFSRALDTYSQIGVEPRYTLLKKATAECFTRLGDGTKPAINIMIPVLRAAFKYSAKSKKIKSFWDREVSLVLDWIQREQPQFDSNQQKAPWTWFIRQQKDWHERMQLLKRESLKKEYWESLLDTFEYEGYTIIPLTSSLMLFDEGKEMKHCVGSYSNDCKFGFSRIFSIMKDNKKLATCEIRAFETLSSLNNWNSRTSNLPQSPNGDGAWTVRQVRGPCNDEVDSKIIAVSEHIAKEYNRLQMLKQLK
jgi:hypothetical protein